MQLIQMELTFILRLTPLCTVPLRTASYCAVTVWSSFWTWANWLWSWGEGETEVGVNGYFNNDTRKTKFRSFFL